MARRKVDLKHFATRMEFDCQGIDQKREYVMDVLRKVAKKNARIMERITSQMLADAIIQAIECGDFALNVQVLPGIDNVLMRVDYAPRREHATMQKFITDLKRELAELKGEPIEVRR